MSPRKWQPNHSMQTTLICSCKRFEVEPCPLNRGIGSSPVYPQIPLIQNDSEAVRQSLLNDLPSMLLKTPLHGLERTLYEVYRIHVRVESRVDV